ncbi:hypothetical protein WJX72_011082 [[Myrmecia] bisecta]|uniref:ABM domain-containing protein n=1 Tax=[Myrmecia] bisecta TaxID=41462 RepID=A0AAW1R9S7_9CHLO
MCKQLVAFSDARKAQKGSGVHEFVCNQDNYEANVFHFWERYESNSHMGLHNSTPEVSKFMNEVQEHLEGPIGMALYEWKDGKISNACIQGGPKGEGGLDDATGAGGSGGAGHKQTSGVVDLGDVQRGSEEEGDSWGMGFKFPWQRK